MRRTVLWCISSRLAISLTFTRCAVSQLLVHVEVAVPLVSLGCGHNHASISGVPARTAKSRNASNDRTNATTARNAVIIGAKREVKTDRRPPRTSSDNPSIVAIKMTGGATATPVSWRPPIV
jgi:hypothetical protein